MASEKPIRVAIIGLGFGAEFIPIYQKYPGAEIYAICRRDRKGLDECGDRYGIKARYTDYRELLERSRTSTPSTSTRRSPTTPGCRSRP